jgi:hypothetical protein
MTRLVSAWGQMSRDQRLAALAALALLVTMFLPWYGLQSLDRKTGAIYSHDISAFGDVSFVEAAVFLVAAGVIAMLLARVEGRDFQLPGGDGTIVTVAGGWAALLIFYRVFSRPSGDGYPVGIEWGFFLAFVAAGSLTYAGWRMRHSEAPEPPLVRRRPSAQRRWDADGTQPPVAEEEQPTVLVPARSSERAPRPPEHGSPRARERPRYPPAPPEQLSFEDPPRRGE